MTTNITPETPETLAAPDASDGRLADPRAAVAAIVREVHEAHQWSSNEDRSGSGDCWCDEGLSFESQDDGYFDHVTERVVEALAEHGLLPA